MRYARNMALQMRDYAMRVRFVRIPAAAMV
jgi:hypothetical protein